MRTHLNQWFLGFPTPAAVVPKNIGLGNPHLQ